MNYKPIETPVEAQKAIFLLLSRTLKLHHFVDELVDDTAKLQTLEESHKLLFSRHVPRNDKDKIVSYLKVFPKSNLHRRHRAIARLILIKWKHAPL